MRYPANKLLLIATRRIGDVLLVTPLLHSLRHAYPDAVIDILLYENTGAILEGNPDYNTLISVADHPNFKQYKILLKQIFRRYDLAISTLPGDRPTIYAFLAASKRVSIVPQPCWQDSWKRLVAQAWTEIDSENTHTVIQNLRLADLLGIKRYYQIVTPKSIQNFDIPTQAFAVLHLLPKWAYKRWTLSSWEKVAHYLTQVGLRVVLTGGGDKEEMSYIREALSQMPNTVINLAGKLRFSEVAQLISASKIYIGPDTAITHLAAALGTPTIALYGPTNPLRWAPWPHNYHLDQSPFKHKGTMRVENVLFLQGNGDCVPCHQEGCDQHRQSYSRCLEEIDSITVIEAVKSFLSR